MDTLTLTKEDVAALRTKAMWLHKPAPQPQVNPYPVYYALPHVPTFKGIKGKDQ